MPYTPTTPRNETVPTTIGDDVTQYQVVELVIYMHETHPRVGGILRKTYATQPSRDLPFQIRDVDGNTPIADRWATLCNAANSRYDEIKNAIYDLLANVNDPETGQPYVPAGTIS